jgi:predicted porin
MVAQDPNPVQDPNDDQATPLSGARNVLVEGDNAVMSRHPHTSTTGLAASGLLALSAACVPAGAWAQSDALQIYARLNVGLEAMARKGAAIDADGERLNVTRLSNYRSVLGLRGGEELGAGTRVLYQIEGTLSPDTGAGAIAARDTRLGLEGPWGTLFAGNWTTPYNSATSSLDPFYPTTAGYMSIMGNGSASNADNVTDSASFDRRQKNSVHYWTPTWRGLSLRLAHGVNEERPLDGARPALTSGALLFERGPLFASLGHERHRQYQGPGGTDRGTRLALAYRFGDTRLAVIGERLEYQVPSGMLRRDAWYVSATRQMGAHALRLGVAKAMDGKGDALGRIGFAAAGPDTGAVHATLGYDVALSKRTSLFAFHTRIHNDARAGVDFAINGLDPEPGTQLRGTAIGMRHAF